jgi:cellulose synthase/poly-beta-1,6-N-acetylglucosamine synthase-like glycosyltransferase
MNLDYPRTQLEIIVVDNNSTDGTAEIIKRYPVKYLFEPKRNPGVARNRGIKESSGEFITFTNADCIVDKDWLKYLIKGFTYPIIAGCGGKILSYPPSNWLERFCSDAGLYGALADLQRFSITSTRHSLPYIDIASAIYRHKVLEQIDYLDITLASENDKDLSWRICLRGYQLKYIPEAIIYRKGRDTFGNVYKKIFRSSTDISRLMQKYKDVKILLIPRRLREWVEFFLREPRDFISYFLALNEKKDEAKWKLLFLGLTREIVYLCGGFFGWLRLALANEPMSPRLVISSKLLWRKIDNDKIIIFRPTERSYYSLDDIGSQIWELLVMENKTLDEVVKMIADKYEMTQEEVRRDLIGLLDDLRKAGLEITDFIPAFH